jgi:prepilin-type N-terminal cleavage/methylation domain-containing protein
MRILLLPARPGFSLVELVVALLLVAVGLVAIAAATLLAQRTMAGTAAIERITREVATIVDSLVADPRPTSGERATGGVFVRWVVEPDPAGNRLRIDAGARVGARPVRLTFEALHAAR